MFKSTKHDNSLGVAMTTAQKASKFDGIFVQS